MLHMLRMLRMLRMLHMLREISQRQMYVIHLDVELKIYHELVNITEKAADS